MRGARIPVLRLNTRSDGLHSVPRHGWEMLSESGRLIPLCTEAYSDPGPYAITVTDSIGNVLATAYAHSYSDAAAYGQSLAYEHPYGCTVTVSITYALQPE